MSLNLNDTDWYIANEEDRDRWKQQRIERGYADVDAWNMFDFLQNVIPGMARQIADGHTYSARMTPEEWHNTLIQMAECFELMIAHGEAAYGERDEEEYKAAEELGFKLLKENFIDLWD